MRWTLSVALLCSVAHGQTLAHRNWAGSGLSAAPWWQSAIFYRIVPTSFQDSDGDGKGDLAGVAQRMGYLQTLAVDAIVLESAGDGAGFDELIREASSRHIRVLMGVSAADESDVVNAARSWLTKGCAGICLQVPPKADAAQTAKLIRNLRSLVDSFPGQRVLVEDASDDPAQLPIAGAQLITRALMSSIGGQADALSLRVQMAQFGSLPAGSAPVIVLRRGSADGEADSAHHEALEKMLAASLLLSRGCAVIDAGQEIDHRTTDSSEQVMRWTPSNMTRDAVPEPPTPAAVPAKPRREDEYGAYVPYVAPKQPKKDAASGPDLNALPGFSTVAVATAPGGTQNNVASEDANTNSLLNFYRRLSQLHHENTTLRTGATTLLNHDAEDVLVWVRRVPADAHAAAVFVAANVSDSAKTISVVEKPGGQGGDAGGMHPLLSTSPLNTQVLQRASAVRLAPWSVLVLSTR